MRLKEKLSLDTANLSRSMDERMKERNSMIQEKVEGTVQSLVKDEVEKMKHDLVAHVEESEFAKKIEVILTKKLDIHRENADSKITELLGSEQERVREGLSQQIDSQIQDTMDRMVNLQNYLEGQVNALSEQQLANQNRFQEDVMKNLNEQLADADTQAEEKRNRLKMELLAQFQKNSNELKKSLVAEEQRASDLAIERNEQHRKFEQSHFVAKLK